jgi:hypothetical protein
VPCNPESMETAVSQRRRWWHVLAAAVAGLLVAGAWLSLWEFVLTPFEHGTFWYYAGGGLGVIVVGLSLIRAVPFLHKQAAQDLSKRAWVILITVSVLVVLGESMLSAWAAAE